MLIGQLGSVRYRNFRQNRVVRMGAVIERGCHQPSADMLTNTRRRLEDTTLTEVGQKSGLRTPSPPCITVMVHWAENYTYALLLSPGNWVLRISGLREALLMFNVPIPGMSLSCLLTLQLNSPVWRLRLAQA